MKNLILALGTLLAILGITVFPCYAQGNVIYGCYQKNEGQLRIVSNPNSCRPSEIPISWYGGGPGVPVENDITVDCNLGQTISSALESIPGRPLIITVRGICNENIILTRDDVTLKADANAGGGIFGPDQNKDAILIKGSRAVLTGMDISGGYNAVRVTGDATIKGCTLHNAFVRGVWVFHGGRALLDNNTIKKNQRQGVFVEGSQATLLNNTITENGSAGVQVQGSGFARIGIPDDNITVGPGKTPYAKNYISKNGGTGILVQFSASAIVGGNDITGNGTNYANFWNQYGVFAGDNGMLEIVGGNNISDNIAGGVVTARNGSIRFGNTGWGTPVDHDHLNIITRNGSGAPGFGGIQTVLGSTIDFWGYVSATGNYNWDLLIEKNSMARFRGSENTVGYITLHTGASVFFDAAASVLNGINCDNTGMVGGNLGGLPKKSDGSPNIDGCATY